jgi:hypothetical protein
MFFDKSWAEVTDEDIENLAIDLENKTCGWVFHSKFNPDMPSPDLSIEIQHPEVMQVFSGVEVE